MAALVVAVAGAFGWGFASASRSGNDNGEMKQPIASSSSQLPPSINVLSQAEPPELITGVPTVVTAGPSDLNGGLPCPLLGRTAAEAVTHLSALGMTIRWAFESPTSPDGDGHRSTPRSVPMDSIVMDVSPLDAGTVLVGVHAADDFTHNTPKAKRDKDC